MYLLAKAVSKGVVYSFFREINVLNQERVPLYGPVIFVGNHNNQFVDGSMLLAMLPRRVRLLVAEKSLKRPIIGCLANATGCISVARRQDKIYRGLGLIHWKANSKTLIGEGTRFLLDLHVGDTIRCINGPNLGVVHGIISDTEILVEKPMKPMTDFVPTTNNTPSTSETGSPAAEHSECLVQPHQYSSGDALDDLAIQSLPFMVVPRVDQSDVYEAVADALIRGDCIGIFPEGGSHDRLQLLPLKPGVAIMALTAALEGAEDVMIVPIGLTYYQAHKILSRATIQIGIPIRIPDELVVLYRDDSRAAIAQLMEKIEQSLKQCIISAPNYTSLTAVRLCVTLYVPESMFIPADKYHTLYHQFSILFAKHEKHSELIDFTQKVQDYVTLLRSYGIADHEVRQLKQTPEEAIVSFLELVFIFLIALVIGLVPSILWGPVRVASSYLAEQHRKKALAASTVKITGRDVVASYKILTLMVLLPAINCLYGLLFGLYYFRTSFGVTVSAVSAVIMLPCLYYYSIRYFAKLPALLRKFRFILLVLVCKLNAWRDNEKQIITCRMQMQLAVRKLAQNLGPLTSDTFMDEMERCIPAVVCAADSNRIRYKLSAGDFIPLSSRRFLEGREEIL